MALSKWSEKNRNNRENHMKLQIALNCFVSDVSRYFSSPLLIAKHVPGKLINLFTDHQKRHDDDPIEVQTLQLNLKAIHCNDIESKSPKLNHLLFQINRIQSVSDGFDIYFSFNFPFVQSLFAYENKKQTIRWDPPVCEF